MTTAQPPPCETFPRDNRGPCVASASHLVRCWWPGPTELRRVEQLESRLLCPACRDRLNRAAAILGRRHSSEPLLLAEFGDELSIALECAFLTLAAP